MSDNMDRWREHPKGLPQVWSARQGGVSSYTEGGQVTKKAEKALLRALCVVVSEHMPWPFTDVSRHSQEFRDCRDGIVGQMLLATHEMFDSLAQPKGDKP
jgi:hypothetical protein